MKSGFDAMEMLRAMAPLERTLVHDDNGRALGMIAAVLPDLVIESFPSDEIVWTWRIPNKWRVVESRIEDAMSGELLWDGLSHPLATVNYSLPFEGEIDREGLASHLFSVPERPNAIPFIYRFYNRDWGFCLPETIRKDILKRERFRIRIVTEEVAGALQVGVLTLPGDSDAELLVVSNICHPGIANDSLTGVMAAIDLALHLSQRARKYTYRFLFLPETIGSVAYLAHHPEVVDRACGGFFSEMLGNDNNLCLQFTRSGNSYWDSVALQVLKGSGLSFRTAKFLESAANDEKVLDAPGVDIPTLSLTRYPYPEYHTSDDNADLIDSRLLIESFGVIRTLFDCIEDDYVPVYLQRGPVCLSEHDLYPDWYRDPSLTAAWQGFVKVMYALDSQRSCEELAAALDVQTAVVRHWCDAFAQKGFVRRIPHVVSPRRALPR